MEQKRVILLRRSLVIAELPDGGSRSLLSKTLGPVYSGDGELGYSVFYVHLIVAANRSDRVITVVHYVLSLK